MKWVYATARSEKFGHLHTGEKTDRVATAYGLQPGELVVAGYIMALTWLHEFALSNKLGELYDIEFRVEEEKDYVPQTARIVPLTVCPKGKS